jgi:hypothetical protein
VQRLTTHPNQPFVLRRSSQARAVLALNVVEIREQAGEGHALNSARLDARVPNGCAAGRKTGWAGRVETE